MENFFTTNIFKLIILISFLFINIGFSISLVVKNKLSSIFTIISTLDFIFFDIFITAVIIFQFNNNLAVINQTTFNYFISILIASCLLSWIASTFSSSYMGVFFLSIIFAIFLLMFFLGFNSLQNHNFILLVLSIILSLSVLSTLIFLICFTIQDLKKVSEL